MWGILKRVRKKTTSLFARQRKARSGRDRAAHVAEERAQVERWTRRLTESKREAQAQSQSENKAAAREHALWSLRESVRNVFLTKRAATEEDFERYWEAVSEELLSEYTPEDLIANAATMNEIIQELARDEQSGDFIKRGGAGKRPDSRDD